MPFRIGIIDKVIGRKNRQEEQSRRVPNLARIGLYFVVDLVLATMFFVLFVGKNNILASASKTSPYSAVLVNFYNPKLFDPHSRRVICMTDSLGYYPPDMSPVEGDPKMHLPKLIEDIFKSELSQEKITFIEWAFMAAGMQDFFCMYYKAEEYSPDLIIVPINWRRFGSKALRNSNPQLSALTPLRSELPQEYTDPIRSRGISLLAQIRYKLAIEWSLYPTGIKNWAEEKRRSYLSADKPANGEQSELVDEGFAPIRFGDTNVERMFGELLGTRSQTTSQGNHDQARPKEEYPMEVGETNFAFRDLKAFAEIASTNQTPVLFFVWPVDKEFLFKEGKWEQSSFERSKRLIEEATNKKNCHFVDLSETLEHRYFADRRGHCHPSGRKIIAEQLAPTIREILELNDTSLAETSRDIYAGSRSVR